MKLPKDIYVGWVHFRPHTLCILAESLSVWWRGVQQLAKTQGNWRKNHDLLCIDTLLEVWHVMFYTQLTMTRLTQVINQWAKIGTFENTCHFYEGWSRNTRKSAIYFLLIKQSLWYLWNLIFYLFWILKAYFNTRGMNCFNGIVTLATQG